MVEWASGPPPKQPANPLWSGRVREGGAVNLGVTGQGGRPTMSPPLTRASTLHPLSNTATSLQGRNQPCQPWESRKPPGPILALHRRQASSRNIQSGHCFSPSLSDATSICFVQNKVTYRNQAPPAISGEFDMHTHRCKNSSLKRFNYVSEWWWAMTCLIGCIKGP